MTTIKAIIVIMQKKSVIQIECGYVYVRLQVVVNISSIELKTKVILNDDSQQLYNTKTSTSNFEKKNLKYKSKTRNTTPLNYFINVDSEKNVMKTLRLQCYSSAMMKKWPRINGWLSLEWIFTPCKIVMNCFSSLFLPW